MDKPFQTLPFHNPSSPSFQIPNTPTKGKPHLQDSLSSLFTQKPKPWPLKNTPKIKQVKDSEMSVLGAISTQILCREGHQHQILSNGRRCLLNRDFGSLLFDRRNGERRRRELRVRAEAGFWPDLSRPPLSEMESIADSDQLDRILVQAQELSQPVVIDWMATWCRKCIYLKPKLEKLAADYVSKVKFYYIDVNKVPQSLVKRGNISKMPTIQLWKDGEMKAEVIGGHKGWLVIEEVKEMIQKFVP